MANGEISPPIRLLRSAEPKGRTFVEVDRLRGLRDSEQVAAICYRVRSGNIEFLLVRTGGGRWIFPKGSAEPGLTTAQAAALEAFEEAGVHGRMEESPFTRYIRPRGRGAASIETTVTAHLCEVSWLDTPQEPDRHPTWFSAEKTKRRLQQDRASDYADELVRVIERAVTRITHRNRNVRITRRLVVLDNSAQREQNKVTKTR